MRWRVLSGYVLRTSSFVLLLAGCGHQKPRPRRGVVERLPRLEVVAPARTAVTRKLEVAASVEPLKRVDLSARVPGVVDWMPDAVDIGRAVKKDEVLIRLAVPELRADLAQREALLAQAIGQEEQARETLAVAEREVVETQKDEKRFVAEVEFGRLRYARIQSLVRQRAQDVAVEQEAERQLAVAVAALDANRARVVTRQAKVRAATA